MTTTKHGYVYVAYSRADSEVAGRLSDELSRAGFDVWRDVEMLTPGSEWLKELDRALAAASAVLVVLSPEAARSEFIKSQIRIAVKLEKPVILVRQVTELEVPAYLSDTPAINLEAWNEGVDELQRTLESILQKGAPGQPAAEKSKGYVFLSYAQEDASFVKALKGFLKEGGYGYWDYEESDRDYHSQLFLELEGVITESAAVLSVLSPDWKRSEWAVKEFLFSQNVGKPVFLLMAREMGPTLATAGVPYIDFTNDIDLGFAKLRHELDRKGL